MPIISNLSPELSELLQTSNYTRIVEKGTYLFREGTTATELFFIQNGMIQLNKINADGRELTLRICSKGDIIGESMLFSPNMKYTLNAKVIEDGEVAIILKDSLEKKLCENHFLALEFIKWMSIQQRKTQSKF